MNGMYQSVIQETTTIKIDLQLAEKKGVRKDERIKMLEQTLMKERETVSIQNILRIRFYIVTKFQKHN